MFTPTDSSEIANGIYAPELEGLYFISSNFFSDDRGSYAELVRLPELEAVRKQAFPVVQVNVARSKVNVARGIHAEQWNKLVTVTNGVAFCAFVDFRTDSATFGKSVTAELGIGQTALHGSFFISSGIGNSLCVTQGPVDYLYYVDQLYKDRDVSHDQAVSLFDPELAIPWPIEREKMILSERDQTAITLKELFPEKYA